MGVFWHCHRQGQRLLAYSSSPVPVKEAAFMSLPLISPGSSSSRALCRGDAVRHPLSMCLFSTRAMRRIRGKPNSPNSDGMQSEVQVVFIGAATPDETEDRCSPGSCPGPCSCPENFLLGKKQTGRVAVVSQNCSWTATDLCFTDCLS